MLPDCDDAVAGFSEPNTSRQLCSFLGMAGFHHIWIPNFGLRSKPWYKATKRTDCEPLVEGECQKSRQLREKLLMAPAMGLPDQKEPYDLSVHQNQGAGWRALTHHLGNTQHPVASFSRTLGIITQEGQCV